MMTSSGGQRRISLTPGVQHYYQCVLGAALLTLCAWWRRHQFAGGANDNIGCSQQAAEVCWKYEHRKHHSNEACNTTNKLHMNSSKNQMFINNINSIMQLIINHLKLYVTAFINVIHFNIYKNKIMF